MTTVLLSAGNATRLGDRAPLGCKALVSVGGRTMVDWWLDIDPELILVCRSEHVSLPCSAPEIITCDSGGGPARALDAALWDLDGDVTVAYADTWVPAWGVPKGTDWCGVSAVRGGRNWDVVEDGIVASAHPHEDDAVLACVGLYRFSDIDRLTKALAESIAIADFLGGEAGLADVVNAYGLTFKPVPGWQDVGDPNALRSWRPL